MLRIRLSRGGSKKRPYYHVVVTDSRQPRDSGHLERVGHYNPMLPQDAEGRFGLNAERIAYWMGKGAQPSDRVSRFMEKAGIGPKFVWSETPKKSTPKAKAQERLKAAADAKPKPAEAAPAEAPAPAPAPAEDAPAEAASA